MTTATEVHDSKSMSVLYVAFELGLSSWKLAMTVGPGQKPRIKTVPAGAVDSVEREIAAAKQRFQLPPEARALSCYEAGREGFWLHRALLGRGIDNQVVDSSSIEVNRRQRRAKTDRMDAVKLVAMLIRYAGGERHVWSVVQPPTVQQEDDRHLHRELETLQHERRQLANRISSLLATVGVACKVNHRFAERLPQLRQWDGQALPAGLHTRLQREFERWQLTNIQLRAVERQLRELTKKEAAEDSPMQCLLGIRGVGAKGAWILLREGLVWRQFRNRRELASLVGLTPTPYHSGTIAREQGISKAGNGRLRRLLVELAWGWLRLQPDSELTAWYHRRFGVGNGRSRKVGIVALARKLLVALWRLATQGELPAGVELIGWESKFSRRTNAVPA
jgi:transposase